MSNLLRQYIWSNIKSLDKLRSEAAASGTGVIKVSIEQLNEVAEEVLERLQLEARL